MVFKLLKLCNITNIYITGRSYTSSAIDFKTMTLAFFVDGVLAVALEQQTQGQ